MFFAQTRMRVYRRVRWYTNKLVLKFSPMAKMKRQPKKEPALTRTSLSPTTRILLAFALPFLGALLLGIVADIRSGRDTLNSALLLGGIGVISWFLGLFWYGLPAMGLRGKRPLFAGIGFAALGWLAFLLLRFRFVGISLNPADSGRAFVFILLFEAFAVQLWTFGLLFRSLADWRGPMTAAVGSGLVFGAVAFTLFQEVFVSNPLSLAYFMMWGVLYGIIRLRTGSLLGTVTIQALHSFTAWVALGPMPILTPPSNTSWLYGLSILAYLVIIWRLWPKEESDYRI
jgi:hypothetical protein